MEGRHEMSRPDDSVRYDHPLPAVQQTVRLVLRCQGGVQSLNGISSAGGNEEDDMVYRHHSPNQSPHPVQPSQDRVSDRTRLAGVLSGWRAHPDLQPGSVRPPRAQCRVLHADLPHGSRVLLPDVQVPGVWVLLRGPSDRAGGAVRSVNVLVMIVAYINSAANPILYSIFSQNFRKNFREALCAWRKNVRRRAKKKEPRRHSTFSTSSRFGRLASLVPSANTDL
ncbi:hypothetical protein C0Q70_20425 [Pomacea canaliculata]|uniref:G-protein coupled receptors family 1 profile domain-containing protein n=1 Tax=Pomacea canaliculata TaxID=400727 RepID=A0A2T7NFJ1_POMCA|nr:hypothetical protein C0Q70_20425 [Pomacea canaliculata]